VRVCGQVLKTKTLPELVQHSNELSVEIKELDSDMQMLVYENYNKFISTTDTIQDMKTKVDGMEGDMGRLTTAVSEITGLALPPCLRAVARRKGVESGRNRGRGSAADSTC
jgi:hypothetical protein